MSVTTKSRRKRSRFSCENCLCCFKNVGDMSDDNGDRLAEKKIALNSNVPSPYTEDLPKDLKVGTAICVNALVLPNCLRFAINLTCGRGPGADIGFHFNPRLVQRYVVRNCRLKGCWGEEETTSTAKFDFERKKRFNVDILVGNGEFLVSVNGRHFCAFRFRVPLDQLTGIEIEGNVEVCHVNYKKLSMYPDIDKENIPVIETRTDLTPKDGDDCLEIPFTGLLPEGLRLGWQLVIYGRVKILPHSFYVNLQEGAQIWPHPTIPLHLNPRFRTPKGEHQFIRNAWLNGSWGQEECAPGFQFSPASPFKMAIRPGHDHFSVWVNGQLSGEFKFRCPIDKINVVFIHGDVIIRDIFMAETANELYFNKNI